MLTDAYTKAAGSLSGIQPDPCCWAPSSIAHGNKQSNQKTTTTPPEFLAENQFQPAPLHLINPNHLNLTENPQALSHRLRDKVTWLLKVNFEAHWKMLYVYSSVGSIIKLAGYKAGTPCSALGH